MLEILSLLVFLIKGVWAKSSLPRYAYTNFHRHAKNNPNKIAIIWEGDDPKNTLKITYKELLLNVSRTANALKNIDRIFNIGSNFLIDRGDLSKEISIEMIPVAQRKILSTAYRLKNKIYKGHDVVPWSGRSGTSYSQMEIIEGRKLVSHRAVFVRFPIIGRDKEFLLVWTTTPWTLTSNVIVGINGDLDYIKLKASDDSIYYFAKENLQFKRLDKQFKEKKQWIDGVPKLKTIAQIFKERGGYEILDTIKGEEMVGWSYDGPYDHLDAQSESGGYPFENNELAMINACGKSQHQVINPGKDNMGNDIVIAGEGTGIVHMAPGCGDIDNKVGSKLGIVNLSLIHI